MPPLLVSTSSILVNIGIFRDSRGFNLLDTSNFRHFFLTSIPLTSISTAKCVKCEHRHSTVVALLSTSLQPLVSQLSCTRSHHTHCGFVMFGWESTRKLSKIGLFSFCTCLILRFLVSAMVRIRETSFWLFSLGLDSSSGMVIYSFRRS